jgi:hypothetical protein
LSSTLFHENLPGSHHIELLVIHDELVKSRKMIRKRHSSLDKYQQLWQPANHRRYNGFNPFTNSLENLLSLSFLGFHISSEQPRGRAEIDKRTTTNPGGRVKNERDAGGQMLVEEL